MSEQTTYKQFIEDNAIKLDFNDAQFLSCLLSDYMKEKGYTDNGHLKNLLATLKAGV